LLPFDESKYLLLDRLALPFENEVDEATPTDDEFNQIKEYGGPKKSRQSVFSQFRKKTFFS